MRVVVTGAAGFIGTHVLLELLRAGHDVVGVDVRELNAPVERVLGSITDPAVLAEALDGADAVIHLAAIADVLDAALDPAGTFATNVLGTTAVLEAVRVSARPIRVVHASTIWVYDRLPPNGHGSLDEATPLALANHVYTASKIGAEQCVTAYTSLCGVDATILRFGIPFGLGERETGLIPTFFQRARSGLPLMIEGDGRQTRQFVAVKDLARAAVMAAACPTKNPVLNVAYADPVSVRHIAELIQSWAPDISVSYTEPRSGDFAGARIDVARARHDLGWEPAASFSDALRAHWEAGGGTGVP